MNSKLSLRWRDHHSALITMLENHLDNSTLSDCVIAAEGQYIKAHKVVLSSCSPYFQLLFTLENEKNPIVVLKDVKFDDLKAVIDFVYRGEVQVFEDQLVTFLETAESLQIKGLGRNNNERFGKRKKGDSPGKRSREHSSTPPPEDCAAKRQAYEAEEEALELVPVMDETQRDCWKGAKREPFCSDLPSTSSKEPPPYNFRSAKIEAPSSQGSTQGSTMHLDIAPALPEPSLSAEDCLAETDSVVKTESLSDSEMGQTEEYMEDALSEGGGEGFMRNEMEDMVGGPSGGHGGSSGCTGRTMEQPMMRTHYPGGPPSQPESSSLATDNAMMASQMANSQDFMLGLGTLESTSNGSVPGGHMASEPSTSLEMDKSKTPKFKRKFISLEDKINILDRVMNGEKISNIAKTLNLNEATIRTIKKSEKKIRRSVTAGSSVSARYASRPRLPILVKMEKVLSIWIDDCYQNKIPLNGNSVKQKALEIYNSLKKNGESSVNPDFVASTGWFEKFKKRFPIHSIKIQGEFHAHHEAAEAYPDRIETDLRGTGIYIGLGTHY